MRAGILGHLMSECNCESIILGHFIRSAQLEYMYVYYRQWADGKAKVLQRVDQEFAGDIYIYNYKDEELKKSSPCPCSVKEHILGYLRSTMSASMPGALINFCMTACRYSVSVHSTTCALTTVTRMWRWRSTWWTTMAAATGTWSSWPWWCFFTENMSGKQMSLPVRSILTCDSYAKQVTWLVTAKVNKCPDLWRLR